MRNLWLWCLVGSMLLFQSGCCWWRPHHCCYQGTPEPEPVLVVPPPR